MEERINSLFELSAAMLTGKTVVFMKDGTSGDVVSLEISDKDKAVVKILCDQDGFIKEREYSFSEGLHDFHIKEVVETLNASRDI